MASKIYSAGLPSDINLLVIQEEVGSITVSMSSLPRRNSAGLRSEPLALTTLTAVESATGTGLARFQPRSER